jgi:HD-GYP domain-containing protein (c-di-GMP phosphodiesterase class II)
MKEFKIDFYNSTNLKSYDLNESMRYQLAMLDSLDVFTRLHSEHVANLTCRICEYMHMKDYFTVYCTMCAYLHDIGKQFIPPSILQKNGSLTDEEYKIMKSHTTIGYEMCMRDEKLRPYAAGPIYHHEGLDGSGYPRSLTQNDIPLEGQIIRVADEFDAITSKRQYKSHVGVCETLNILISETVPSKKTDTLKTAKNEKIGKVNPKVVKALIKVIIDDTEYELYKLGLYVDYLKSEANRLEKIIEYENKMNKASNDSDKAYYAAVIKELLVSGETLENYKQVLKEYQIAYEVRKESMIKLGEELKQMKRLKV